MITRRSLAIGFAALLSACATLRAPARSSGPAVSTADGVQLTVTRQSCQRSGNPDLADAYLIEETVEIEARSSAPIEIRRDAFRLLTPSGYRLQPVSWGAAEPLAVEPGRPQTFALRFMANGTRDCTSAVKLDPNFAVRRAGAPVALGAITFTPSANL
ncbi:MAG TPA: hypothetical protein VHK47_08110 [Polyangia bacterium]|nr:hypothetical protein [Polyangia bacterium]